MDNGITAIGKERDKLDRSGQKQSKRTKEQKLKFVDIARAVGCTEGTFSLWMSGARNPKLNNKIAIADFLEVSLHWLETGEELPDPKTLPYISLDEASAFFDELDERRQQVLLESAICIIAGFGALPPGSFLTFLTLEEFHLMQGYRWLAVKQLVHDCKDEHSRLSGWEVINYASKRGYCRG